MAVKILSMVFDGFPGGGSEYLAMIVLADWSDDHGKCFPSIASIARKTRLSQSQARRIVHSLIDDGFVNVTGNKFGGKPGSSRQYQIALDRLTASTRATPSADARACSHARDDLHGCAETASTHASLTVTEPTLTVNALYAQFWDAYPRKKNKGDAEKAFKAIKVDSKLLGEMLSAIASQKQSQPWRKDGGQFIPYPATWLRARGWEDVPDGMGVGGVDEFTGAI